MAAPASIRPVPRISPRPTTFRPGVSGNPVGKPRSRAHNVTIEAREAAQRIVDDPGYRAELRQRMIDGTAGAMGPPMWFYAKGRPAEHGEQACGESAR